MKNILWLLPFALLALGSAPARAEGEVSPALLAPESADSAVDAMAANCPAGFPLYCAAVDRCCPSGHGYYCTNWQSLPAPSPLSRSLNGPCLNIKGFTSGQQYYLEQNCNPHGCG